VTPPGEKLLMQLSDEMMLCKVTVFIILGWVFKQAVVWHYEFN
jgi:hypothetical protein